ncbi:MAG: SGNH/GDSL hydrolase family protein [Acidobacteriota bacterium]|nr:SGNH/GDSL hydrolase family protein [Acidobacteriota bacterium]
MKFFAVTGLILLSPVCSVFASSFSQLVVFGDSLSDNGNAYLVSKGAFPGPNYGVDPYTGAVVYSDGTNTSPVAAGPGGLWVDQISSKLGVADPQPFLAGGNNYAVASAETGKANPQDMGYQLGFYSAAHPTGASSTALYAFWGGANDILDGKSPTQAADNIETYIKALSVEGAKNFVWLNLPLLGDTPDGQPAKAQLNAASVAFNGEWASGLAALQGGGIHVVGVNIDTLFTSLIGDPGAYGLTDVTHKAQTSGLADDAGYLFWDGKHPTSAGHALIADDVDRTLTATPEPASAALAIFGMLAVAGLGVGKRSSRIR